MDLLYTKFTRDVLTQVVMAIRRQATEAYHFKSDFVAARGMIIDLEQLSLCFAGYFDIDSNPSTCG